MCVVAAFCCIMILLLLPLLVIALGCRSLFNLVKELGGRYVRYVILFRHMYVPMAYVCVYVFMCMCSYACV